MRKLILVTGTMLVHPTIALTNDGLDRLGIGFGGLDIVDDIFIYVTFAAGSNYGRIWAVPLDERITVHHDDNRFATVTAADTHATFLGLITLADVLVMEGK